MTNSIGIFRTAGEIITGAGCAGELGRVTSSFSTRAVVVTGRESVRASGVLDKVLANLSAAGVASVLFEGVEEDPDVSTVDGIRALVASEAAGVVLGLGGGSAMDAAKAAAGLANEDEPASVFLHEGKRARPGAPLVTVPTTSGTGAEVTPNAVISDRGARAKKSIRNGSFVAAAAVVDPELTLSCPPRVTAESGMDALTQAIESYVSINATPLSDALAFRAFELLWRNLERAYRDGTDVAARTACSYGSLMAGMSLSAARLGAVHGMAHPLGARYGMPHGLVCAVLLPEVARVNIPFAPEKFARMSAVAKTDFVDALRSLNERLGIYEHFREYAIPETDFDAIAAESLPSGSLKANPKKFEAWDVVEVLRAVTG